MNEDLSQLNFQDVCDNKLANKTKANYNNRIKAFIKWLRTNYSTCFKPNDAIDDNSENDFDSDLILTAVNEEMLEKWLSDTAFFKKGKKKGMVKTKSSSEGNRAALIWYFNKNNVPIASFQSRSKGFLKGIGKEIAALKERGEIDNTEGKDVLTMDGYKSLCQLAMESTNNSRAHLFLTLAWNLMTRSVTTSMLLVSHLSWGGDCIRVSWGGKHKSNQSGDQGSRFYEANVRHIYANPIHPEMCCFLALGIWLISCTSMSANSPLFSCEREEENFNNWLRKTFDTMSDEKQMECGFNFARYSSHSTKKGGSSYAASLPGLCNIIALWLRAGWSIGAVLPAYIHANEAGDQNCGRVLSGLNPSNPELSTLPARFKPNMISTIQWMEFLNDFSTYPSDFKIVIPYLIASVVHHRETICNILPSTHPVFLSRFWRSAMQEKLRDYILPPCRMHCDVTGMQASGVPPVTSLQHEFHSFGDTLLQKLSTTQPITRNDFQTLSTEIRCEIRESVASALAINTSQQSSTLQQSAVSLHSSSSAPSHNSHLIPYANWNWGGQFARPLPEGELFPTKEVKLRTIFELWHFGREDRNIRPYKEIDAEHFSGDKKIVRKSRSQAKSAVEKMDGLIKSINNNFWVLPIAERDAVWSIAMQQLEQELNPLLTEKKRKVRLHDMAYCSLYENYLSRSNKKKSNNNENSSS